MQHVYMELEDLLARQPNDVRRRQLVDLLESYFRAEEPPPSRDSWGLLSARPWSLASGFLFDIAQDDSYWLEQIASWRKIHSAEPTPPAKQSDPPEKRAS